MRLDQDESQLGRIAAAALNIDEHEIVSVSIVRKAVDARRKSDILRVYTVDLVCRNEERILARNRHLATLLQTPEELSHDFPRLARPSRVLVVGMGPAGLFSALSLAEAGARVCLVERGTPVAERWRDVKKFWSEGLLSPDSNIQFGEGGAGTFSDGKLTCRLNHPATRSVLKTLVAYGAPADILIQAKPHIGSDRLRAVLVGIRRRLIALGTDIRFRSRLSGLEIGAGTVRAGIVNDSEAIACDHLVLATGHSARDTYELLESMQISMEQKAFAVGLRVEHPLELINRIQYGLPEHPQLPAADYRLAWNDPESGRGIYSFCMCPGGMVVNASSEPGGLVVNGMSNFRRDDPCSNSALVVSVDKGDFGSSDVLAGVEFQRRWERRAFELGGGNWGAPAQPLVEYLNGRGGGSLGSSCRPAVVHADLKQCLPAFVDAALRKALPVFDRKMKGFAGAEAVLVGVETRTSAPVRILRDQGGESVSVKRLYPAGEGAGYAGGIMSAALDGLRVAGHIIQKINES